MNAIRENDLRRWIILAVCVTFFSTFVIVLSGIVLEYLFGPPGTQREGHLFGLILVIIFVTIMIFLRILWKNNDRKISKFLIADKQRYHRSKSAFSFWFLFIVMATLSLSYLARYLLSLDSSWFLYHVLLAIVIAVASFRFLVLGSRASNEG